MERPIPDIVKDTELESDVQPEHTTHLVWDSSSRGPPRRIPEQWKSERQLGRGAFGTVSLQTCVTGRKPGRLRAVKAIEHHSETFSSSEISRELEAIGRFSQKIYRHRFARSYGWYRTESTIFVAMEYLPLGDLDRYLNHPLPEPEAASIARQLVEGLRFMHDLGFVHRDLKPKNILVEYPQPNWYIKIADFGISRKIAKETSTLTVGIGTLNYMAPEALGVGVEAGLKTGPFVFAVDMWALGTIAWQLITSAFPFPSWAELYGYINRPQPPVLIPKAAATISTDCVDFINKALTVSTTDRLTSKQASEHPWFQRQGEEMLSSTTVSITDGHVPKQEAQIFEEQRETNEETVYGTWSSTVAAVGANPVSEAAIPLENPETEMHNDDAPQSLLPDLNGAVVLGSEKETETSPPVTADSGRSTPPELPDHLAISDKDLELETSRLAHIRGLRSFEQGDFAGAEAHLRLAVSGRKHTLGKDHADTIRSVYYLGRALYSQKKYQQAETQFQMAASGWKRTLGANAPDTLSSINYYKMASYKR